MANHSYGLRSTSTKMSSQDEDKRQRWKQEARELGLRGLEVVEYLVRMEAAEKEEERRREAAEKEEERRREAAEKEEKRKEELLQAKLRK